MNRMKNVLYIIKFNKLYEKIQETKEYIYKRAYPNPTSQCFEMHKLLLIRNNTKKNNIQGNTRHEEPRERMHGGI